MSPIKKYLVHLLISFVVLGITVGGLFLSQELIRNFIDYPRAYVDTELPVPDLFFAIIFISLLIISIFFSYIIYLLLTYNTRFDLEIWNATKSLAISKEQFRRLFESAPVPYVLLNSKAEIFDPNKSALRFFGVLPEEIEGKNLFSFLSEEDKEQAGGLFEYYKASMDFSRKEVDMVTKKGDVRTVQLSIFKMKNPGSFGSTGLAMIFDITEQKQLDRAKTEFVSLASHQLRSPLATTKWLTEMLVSEDFGELSAKNKEYVEKLHAANEDMIDLVDVLLNVSRIEMGSLKVEIVEVNAESIVESILAELEFLIQKNSIHIVKRYEGLLQNIQSDPKLLRIVIQNLITNALKYTPAEGTVTISFEEVGGEKRITVSDTGLGIPESQQGLIFTKLFRADNVRGLNDSQGTGLGLYLVKSVVASIGGSISFVSKEGKGSAFTITL